MERSDPDILVQRFIDGELSQGEIGPALHRIADDVEARELLRFELEVTQDLAATRSSAPPPDFASRVAGALPPEDATSTSEPTLIDRLRAFGTYITTPVSLRVRPAFGLVAVLLMGLGAWLAWPAAQGPLRTTSTEPSRSTTVRQADASASEAKETVWIRFMYTDNEADSVAVAGDFSRWDPIPLSPRTVDGETIWTGLVPVPRGEHEYQFLINGQRWVADPLAPVERNDGFGAKNAVLNI